MADLWDINKQKREQVFDNIMDFVLETNNKTLRNAFNKAFVESDVKIKISSANKLIKKKNLPITDNILRIIILILYKYEVIKEKISDVTHFVTSTNHLILDAEYICLALKSGTGVTIGEPEEFDIVRISKVLSSVNSQGKEERHKNVYEGKYTLVEVDSQTLDKRDAGQCTGGGHCSWFWDIPSPKEKFRKTERVIFEVDGELVLDTTIEDLVEERGQYLPRGDRTDWTIGLDEGEDEPINWRETKSHVYIDNFAISLHETY